MEVDYQYQVDYAKSGRAGCVKCKCPIAQSTLRVARLVQSTHFDGKIPKWFHFDCFFTKNAKIKATSEIKYFDSLRWEDQEKIRVAIGSVDAAVTAKPNVSKLTIKLALPGQDCSVCKIALLQVRKRPVNDVDPEPSNEKKRKIEGKTTSEPDALRQQSQRLWKMRDRLEREVTKDALIGLLEYNEQHVPSGLSSLLDAVSDAMVFGALPLCPSCKNGPLRYSNGQYKCSAMATDWAPCLYNTRDVERNQFRVPNEYFDVEFLKQYKFVKRTRLFATNSATLCTGPLSDYAVFVVDDQSNMTKTKENLVEECRALGASVTHRLSSGVLVVCASATAMEQIAKKDKARMKSMGLRVVDGDLLSELKLSSSTKLSQKQLVKLLNKHTLSDWAVKHMPAKNGKENFTNVRETDELARFKLKGGAVVDPDSGLDHRASVLKDAKGTPMSAVLGMVDLVKGSNSFYKLQALQLDKGGSFSLFRAWGRIGTTIGGTKVEKFTTASAARHAFEDLYLEKTGNEWKDRKNFQKKPNKFYEMELDYADVEEKSQKLSLDHSVPSKLDTSLQQLIQFICDIESMKQTMIEFELDLRKMPLGKLSKRQLHEAYAILGNLSKLMDRATKTKASLDQTVLLSESTRFFTLIPHDFGMRPPPLLSTRKAIKDKLQMLEDLLEIELAYNILKADVSANENPLDQHYHKLNTNLKKQKFTDTPVIDRVLKRTRPEVRYFLNFWFPFPPSTTAVLYHIPQLYPRSQGLRIAPPEAPVTGYMFGKGIYFADIVSKSANYCYTSQSQPEGVLLLCEVILGNMKECYEAESTDLPADKHSRKGMGSVTPNPATFYTNADGVVYPIGEPISSGVSKTTLIYNEYIVYDVAQVKQKYVVRVKFNY
ncbi:Poly [ADP-ribose] polymerase [Paragonimus heterotremus]|uniref:Poly [ADP-ribose] polymerase n=1 Tax=Paragonimus heterotremus TaxID=100268 RepID=A0A8J4X3K1_9TREM|nr:Poly [ADP-ribose] polymerase [Paragonimus heterotremus]